MEFVSIMTERTKLSPSGPLTQRLFNAFQAFKLEITGGSRMKELALSSAYRMLLGAGVLPSTFDASEFTEEKVDVLLVTGSEVLRMLQEGSSESDDKAAREIYEAYFTIRSE